MVTLIAEDAKVHSLTLSNLVSLWEVSYIPKNREHKLVRAHTLWTVTWVGLEGDSVYIWENVCGKPRGDTTPSFSILSKDSFGHGSIWTKPWRITDRCRDFQGDDANSAGFDCVGFRGLCVDCLTEEEYLAEKRRHSWICQGETWVRGVEL